MVQATGVILKLPVFSSVNEGKRLEVITNYATNTDTLTFSLLNANGTNNYISGTAGQLQRGQRYMIFVDFDQAVNGNKVYKYSKFSIT